MAKNDIVIIDGMIDERIDSRVPSERRDEAFEYFAVEQVLKDYDLSADEILSASLDGRDDGGIDSFFIFVNGHIVADPDTFVWPKSNAQLAIWVFTIKHHDTFQQAPVDKLVATFTELFDFKIGNADLSGSYSQAVLSARNLLHLSYRKLSSSISSFELHTVYASRGSTESVGSAVTARANQIVSVCDDLFGSGVTRFEFVGATELVNLKRQIRSFRAELPFVECFSHGDQYLLLTSLTNLKEFVTNESGTLKRHLFDSNVRDYMGPNRVNDDILSTLRNPSSADFWWLNNGVTILSTSASVVGKAITIENVQIVNGLQTTETIFDFFEDGGQDEDRCVLIKVLICEKAEIRDTIIRATNNQTAVELASLTATDKIQRDIEDVMLRSGLYYERRKNFYVNQGVSPREIVTPHYIGCGYVSLVLKSPQTATRLKSRFMHNPNQYSTVFDKDAPIQVWPKIAILLKTVDSVLDKQRVRGASEGFLKKWRQYTAFFTLAKTLVQRQDLIFG